MCIRQKDEIYVNKNGRILDQQCNIFVRFPCGGISLGNNLVVSSQILTQFNDAQSLVRANATVPIMHTENMNFAVYMFTGKHSLAT